MARQTNTAFQNYKLNHLFSFLFIFLFSSLLFSCLGGNDSGSGGQDNKNPTENGLAISKITVASNYYKSGDYINITAKFNKNVKVAVDDGSSSISLIIGTEVKQAFYHRQQDDSTLIFRYQIQDGDNDNDGIEFQHFLVKRNGSTIEDDKGESPSLDFIRPENLHTIFVDTNTPNRPTITLQNPTNNPGDDPPPEINVRLTENGGSVIIYSDINCVNAISSSIPVPDENNQVNILVTNSISDRSTGNYYVKHSDLAGNASSCSVYSVEKIFSNHHAFAALRGDGTVVTWGGVDTTSDIIDIDSLMVSSHLTISEIYSTSNAFAALKDDGSVVTWGWAEYGGDSSDVSNDISSGVEKIFSNGSAFAALKDDGSVVTWGWANAGGDSSDISSDISSGVEKIFSNGGAFAALKTDGSVITWGDSLYSGGDSSDVSSDISSGVEKIFSTDYAFAALKDDGSVVTWGGAGWGWRNYGGDSSDVSSDIASGVSKIFSNGSAFAALKTDGSVITWGDYLYSGGDSSDVSSDISSGVVEVFSTDYAFAALKTDGSVVTWGGYDAYVEHQGGNSLFVSGHLTSGVEKIFSTSSAFAALKDDGSVVTWGDYSGSVIPDPNDLAGGVVQIFSNNDAFAALKDDGSVITWGGQDHGGNSTIITFDRISNENKYSSVASQLTSGVSEIFSTAQAFAALKDDGSVVTWGSAEYGGDSPNSL